MSVSHSLLLHTNISVGKGFDPSCNLNLRKVSKSLYHRDENEHSSVAQQIEIDKHRKQDTQLSAFPYLVYISQLTEGIMFSRKNGSLCIVIALSIFRTKMTAGESTVLYFILRVPKSKGDDTALYSFLF